MRQERALSKALLYVLKYIGKHWTIIRQLSSLLVFLPTSILWAHTVSQAVLTATVIEKNGTTSNNCSNSLLNCLIQVSQPNAICLSQAGAITLTNNSNISAKNIQASSSNPNFNIYVVQNNACPASLPPRSNCTISFYTNASVSFLISNVVVKGTNTNGTYFDMQAVQCPTNVVTPSGDGNETINPSTPQTVNLGATQQFTVTANTGYTLSNTVGGTCPAGSWSGNTYTTGAITGDCSVSFSAIINTYTVTPSGDGNETINPSTPQTVNFGATQQFIVTANTGYTLSNTVGGTCPAGSWSGNTYTTGAITGDCSVSFSATLNTYTVTPSGDGNETINPSTPQTVNFGATQQFIVTANTGYTVDTAVGGTCPSGSWSGTTYTTGIITADCTVIFSASQSTYIVTPSGDGNESILPSTPQTVIYNNTQSFTVTANTNYVLSSVGGTCPAGSWSGSTYTTGAITADCTVTFSAIHITTLGVSVSSLALSVNAPGINAALTGNPRIITLTNTGSYPAENLSITYPTWPAGTTASSTCGATLNASATCTITITPGANATSGCTNGSAPTPGTLGISAANASV